VETYIYHLSPLAMMEMYVMCEKFKHLLVPINNPGLANVMTLRGKQKFIIK